jgi:hypothetical protein
VASEPSPRPSPMKSLSNDAEESASSLELLSNKGHREFPINEKLTEKSNDNDGASYDSFDFIFDDSDPYSNDIEERGQRYTSIYMYIYFYFICIYQAYSKSF